jgi:hypothetical protein
MMFQSTVGSENSFVRYHKMCSLSLFHVRTHRQIFGECEG